VRDRLLLTCEHGGNNVPLRLRKRFQGANAVLRSHRGWDIGALPLARDLSRTTGAPLIAVTVSRLVVEANRTEGHPELFSKYTRDLPAVEKTQVLRKYHRPHHRVVEAWIDRAHEEGDRVIHLGVHSFTPELDGELRNADVGLLYDPARKRERAFAGRWHAALAALDPDLHIRRNYPYLGTADGLVTSLRKRFPSANYAGLELEVNQGLLEGRWRLEMHAALGKSLNEAMARG